MLRNEYEETSQKPMGKKEVCKPDYENIIRELKEHLERTLNLKNALFDYVGVGKKNHVPERIAEMIGDLVVEEKWIEIRIESVIKEQEEDRL